MSKCVLNLKMSTRDMRLEFSRKAGSRHLGLEVIKILVKIVGCIVWQEISPDRHLRNSLRCKEQIEEDKLDKCSKLEIFIQMSRHSESQSTQ